jgi:hypothetical protein
MLLEEDKEHKGHKYVCSNPNCRKVFSRPKIIKYLVCPACQTLVNMAEAETWSETPSSASEKFVKLEKAKMVEAEDSEGLPPEGQPASVEPSLKELFVPDKTPAGSEEAILLENVHMPQQEKVEIPRVQEAKTLEAETVSQSPSNCRYGFGYLARRKKSEQIPDMCIECPMSLNCMLSDYYKKEESVSEIKKWYAT